MVVKRPYVVVVTLSHLDESVLRLDIAVKEAVLVHESNALHHLEHDVSDLGLREGSTALETERPEAKTERNRQTFLTGQRATQKRNSFQKAERQITHGTDTCNSFHKNRKASRPLQAYR